MMINSYSYIKQDTIPVKNIVVQDSVGIKTDSASISNPPKLKASIPHKLVSEPKTSSLSIIDTTSFCSKSSIIDITFYDSNNIVITKKLESFNRFPILFIQKNNQIQAETKASLIKHLRDGQEIAVTPFHNDWILLIILLCAFLFSLIRTKKSILPSVTKFFFFRGINDPSSRDIGGLFHWQSTILNLISFLIIGLFTYSAAAYYDLIPPAISGIIFWLISLGIIISAVTLRHIVCVITGNISEENDVFREYLLGVYQSYRFSALFLFIFVILISYTIFFPPTVYYISGIIVLVIMYLIRIVRLLIIYIHLNISIFYLILYLCGLEILPVLIIVKYFSSLV